MRKELAAVVSVFAASLVASACSDQPNAGPTSPRTSGPNLLLSGPATTCDANALKTYARDYAVSNKDSLNTIISSIQTENNKNGKGFTLTNLAFDGLARLAVMRGNTSLQKTGTAAKTAFDGLVKGFVGCTEDYIRNTAVAEDFSLALGSGWMFEVRGGASDPTSAAYEKPGTPYWSASAAWQSAISVSGATPATNRIVIYGFDLATYPYPVLDDKVGGEGFEIRTIPTKPALSFATPVTVGLCEVTAPTQDVLNKYRTEHKQDLLAYVAPSCDRPTTPSFTPLAANTLLDVKAPFALARRAVDFFAPQPLYAATLFAAGSVGGAVSELSPSVIVNLKSAVFTFVSQPTDGYVNTPIVGNPPPWVRVKVTSLAGTPLPGVQVTISVFNNSGTNVAAGGTVATTSSDGIATFPTLMVNKAGGYTLTASGDFDGIAGSVNSNLFNIQNKSAPAP